MCSRLICTALCALTLACGSTPTPSDPRPLPPPILSGRVSDLNTGAPLTAVILTVIDGPNASRTTVSDAGGRFLFGTLTVGRFTLRARYQGYDSVFQGVNFVADTTLNIQMQPAMQTLSGTWTGTLSFMQNGAKTVAIPQLTLVHTGTSISSTFLTSGPYQGSFSGTLRDPASIASRTETGGTMTVTYDVAGRNPMTCRGTVSFTGTVNWTRAAMTASQITLECGIALTAVTMSLERQQ
jgi:Carboxypeptidase regulatory-like domain